MKQWLKALIWHKPTIITLLISFPLYSTQNTYYIKPTADTPCPGEPCHTLSQYGEQYFQNFSSNTTLVFLPGDHNLNFTISVGAPSNSWNDSQPDHYYPPSSLTLLGNPSSLPEINSRIVCTWPAGFRFSGITELRITALAFISCGHNDSAAINILSVWNVSISNCTFQNNINNWSGSNVYGFGGAIHVHSSNLTLTENTFQHNFAFNRGGALEVSKHNIVTLSRNIFHKNSANYLVLLQQLQTTPSPSQRTHFRTILLIILEVLFMHIQTTHSPSQTTHLRTTLLIMEVLFMQIQTTHSPSQRTYFRTTLLIMLEVLFMHI